MSYEDKQEHTTGEAVGWTIEYSITQKGRYAVFHHGHRVSRWMKKRIEAQRCMEACVINHKERVQEAKLLPPETPNCLYAVAYCDRNYWHLAKYPWVASHTAVEQQVRFLETSLPYKNLHLRIVKITFLEI